MYRYIDVYVLEITWVIACMPHGLIQLIVGESENSLVFAWTTFFVFLTFIFVQDRTIFIQNKIIVGRLDSLFSLQQKPPIIN